MPRSPPAMNETTSHLDSLVALACPGGGWAYAPGQEPHLEPTCLALLALAAERERLAAPLHDGLAWLRGCARPDGTYRLERGRPEAAWPTALALFTLAALGEPGDDLERTARGLLALRGREIDHRGEEDVNDI